MQPMSAVQQPAASATPAPPPSTVDPRRLTLDAAQLAGTASQGPSAAHNRTSSQRDDIDELMEEGEVADAGPVASTSKAISPDRPAKRAASSSPRPAKGTPGSSSSTKPLRKKHRSSAAAGQRSGEYNPPPLPHFTVVRAVHNSRNSPHVIRIHDDASDGSESRWPTEAERRPDHRVQNRENWYECQPRDVGRHKAFREKVGEELAKKLGIANQDPGAEPEYWTVEDLPKGHLFTVHHCVTGSGQARQDVYIFGSSATLKFRTANEFVPHVFWLLQHGPADTLRCECKYCSKKSQMDVNRIVGLTDGRSSSVLSGGTGTPMRSKPAPLTRRAADGTGAAGRAAGATARVARAGDPGTEKLLPPLKGKRAPTAADGTLARKRKKYAPGAGAGGDGEVSPPPVYRGSFTSRQRDVDLQDVSVPRQAEIVWAKLPQPLVSREEGGIAITHWPAVVRARQVASDAKVAVAKKGDANGGSAQDNGKGKGKAVAGDDGDESDDSAVEVKDEGLDGSTTLRVRLVTTQRPVFNLALIGLSDELRRVPLTDTLPWLGHPPPSDLMRPERIIDPDSARHVWDGSRTSRDAKLESFKCAEDAATAIALACQIVAHVVASFSSNDHYAMTTDYIAHKPDTRPDQVAAVERQATKTWAYPSVHFGAELIWIGDVVRLLCTDLSDTIGPQAEADEDRTFFLRIELIYKQPDTNSLKFAGQVWALQDDGAADNAKVNGGAPATNGNGAASSSNGVASSSPAASPAPPSDDSLPRMPPPPAGLRWVQLSAPDSQVHIDFEFIGGRYHPLPSASNSRARIAEVRRSFAPTEVELDEGGEALTLNDQQRALVLAGLKPTVRLYMRAGTWRSDRMNAIIEAEKGASSEVAMFFQNRAGASASDGSASREGSA